MHKRVYSEAFSALVYMMLNVIMNEKVQSNSTTMKESPLVGPLTPVTCRTIQLSRSPFCFLSLHFTFGNRS